MKICAAQTRPVKGDVRSNIEKHKRLIELAIANKADIIIFPELSLTGYEPKLAASLATDKDDNRLDIFQQMSDTARIVIGAGIPIKTTAGVCISMILFQPFKARQLYSKRYLHPDEEPYFVSGQSFTDVTIGKTNIALAICYELSIPEHSANAFKRGAQIYIASVAKSATGVEKAFKSLTEAAGKYAMTVLMANCVGPSDDFISSGKTTAWNSKGLIMGQLDDKSEGIIVFDTDTCKLIQQTI